MKRSEIHKRCLWIVGIILPTYVVASIIWIAANIIFYKRLRVKHKQKVKKSKF